MFEKFAAYLKDKARLTDKQLEQMRAATITKRLRKKAILVAGE